MQLFARVLNKLKSILPFGSLKGSFDDLATSIYEVSGCRFENPSLLTQAFLHSSAIDQDTQTRDSSYERLEFLGDAVLELIVSRFLFENFPDYSEGRLTQMRAQLVNRTILAKTSRRLNFGKLLILGKGGEKDNLRSLDSVLSDVYESFTGALYLDNGFEAAYQFVFDTLLVRHHKVLPAPETQNYKGLLYEFCQKRKLSDPIFDVYDEQGPDHFKEFVIAVTLDGQLLGKGSGKSKKDASQKAAKAALDALKTEEYGI